MVDTYKYVDCMASNGAGHGFDKPGLQAQGATTNAPRDATLRPDPGS